MQGMNVGIIERMYGAVILGALKYGAEMWGIERGTVVTQNQLHFYKRLLGVSNGVANCGVLRE
jgi:predicted GNAT superfamily acetyltransferase